MKIYKMSHYLELLKIKTIRKFAISGEWWIIDGQATFADAEIGDYNHSGVVVEYILGQYDIDPQRVDVNELTDEYLSEEGFTQEEIDVVRDRIDPRDYGMKNLGWKRVAGNNIQTYTLTNGDLHSIADALYEVDESISEDETFNIEVIGNRQYYSDVPYSVICSEDVTQLIPYR